MQTAEPAAALERARVAAGLVFATHGLAISTWLARTPSIRDALGLSPAQFGLMLLCVSTGAVGALPMSGPLVHRFGPARTILGGTLSVTTGLVFLSIGVAQALVPLAAVGFFLIGLGAGTWDVAMNVEGADVERRLGRTLMPRFHAGFSLGTVGGALLGASAAKVGVPVAAQLVGTAVVVIATVILATRSSLPAPEQPAGEERKASGVLRAWREPRTIVIGIMVLAFAFTEGTANDWLTLAFVDGHHTSEALGALGFGCFVTAMTIARLAGGSALARWGRVPVLRGTALIAVGGLLLVVFAPSVPWAMAGALLWGAGASLGFPVGMSAAADDGDRAAVRVSVVSSIGYTAFLAGPPLIGFLAEHAGILRALLVVLGVLIIGLLATKAAGPPPPERV